MTIEHDETRPAVRSGVRTRRSGLTVPAMLAIVPLALGGLVALSLLAPRGDPGPARPATPTAGDRGPTWTPRQPPSPRPLPRFPAAGPLGVGWHPLTIEGRAFAFDLPAEGWVSHGVHGDDGGGWISTGTLGAPDGVRIGFWSPEHLGAHPCIGEPGPPLGPLAGPLADAIAELPGVEVVGPLDVTLNAGSFGQHLVLRLRDDIGCAVREVTLWFEERADPRPLLLDGSTIRVLIGNYGGPSLGDMRFMIEVETWPGLGAELERQIQLIVHSVRPNPSAPNPPPRWEMPTRFRWPTFPPGDD